MAFNHGACSTDLDEERWRCVVTGLKCSSDKHELLQQSLLQALQAEVKTLSRQFRTAARAVLNAFYTQDAWHRLTQLLLCHNPVAAAAKAAALDSQAAELLAYAARNAATLRRIADMLDCCLGAGCGAALMKACWAEPKARVMHSPLTIELKALRSLLAHRSLGSHNSTASLTASVPSAPPCIVCPAGTAHSAGSMHSILACVLRPFRTCMMAISAIGTKDSSALQDTAKIEAAKHIATSTLPSAVDATSATAQLPVQPSKQHNDTVIHAGSTVVLAAPVCGKPAGVTPHAHAFGGACKQAEAVKEGETEEEAMDVSCPICLETMYRPVALGCGHAMCADCAVAAAGMLGMNGDVLVVMHYIPGRQPCPVCRQCGVYSRYTALRMLGKYIKARWPEDWRQRRKDSQGHFEEYWRSAMQGKLP